MAVMFVVLLGIGVRNIVTSPGNSRGLAASQTPAPTEPPLIFKTQEVQPKEMLTIKISDGSSAINIRQKPTIYSEKTGEAKEGDTFEYTALTAGWYEIKLSNGGTGYIAARYAIINK
jgi:hypothetical protein